MKKCTKCQDTKHVSEFNLSKNTRDGLTYICRNCNIEGHKKWLKKKKNREYKRRKDNEYNKNNREKRREAAIRSYRKNKLAMDMYTSLNYYYNKDIK